MSIADNLFKILAELNKEIDIVVVTKLQQKDKIMEIYNTGHRLFGENRVQELIKKKEELPSDIQWHMIGHLQTNKVKYLAPFINMIQSVDSMKLLVEINKQALKNNRTINCLFQFHIASEETKFGLDMNEVFQIIESQEFANMKNVNICGVMGMASFTDDTDLIRNEFKNLNEIFVLLKEKYFSKNADFRHISMGMTNDYYVAAEQGSTMLRIGSKIFNIK